MESLENETEKTDHFSVKHLLRQVYTVYTQQTKEYEAEINVLRAKLEESNREKLAAQATCQRYEEEVLELKKKLSEFENLLSSVKAKQSVKECYVESSPIIKNTKPSSLNDLVESPILNTKPQNFFTTDKLVPSQETQLNPDHTFQIDIPMPPNKVRSRRSLRKSDAQEPNLGDMANVLVPETEPSFYDTESNSPKRTNFKKLSQEKENKVTASKTKKQTNLFLSKKRALGELGVNEEPASKRQSVVKPIEASDDEDYDTDVIPNSPQCFMVQEIGPSPTMPKNLLDSFNDFEEVPSVVSQSSKNEDKNSTYNVENNAGSWKSSVKRNKKPQPVKLKKNFKFTSKYPVILKAPDVNAKKVNYKQTKLTKGSFMPSKASLLTESEAITLNKNAEVQNSLVGMSQLITITDPDGGCAPSKKKRQDIEPSCDSQTLCSLQLIADNRPKKDVETSSSDVILVDEYFFSSEEEGELPWKKTILDDSFDKIPSPKEKEPNYKYKEDVVRGKDKRKKLNAFDCNECEKYYDDLGLTDEDKKKRLKNCSRHRAKHAPPSTPDHYWELDFPDTQECKARGYLNDTQKVQLRPRQRRKANK